MRSNHDELLTAQSGARMKLRFIMDNLHHWRKKDSGGKSEKAALSFDRLVKTGSHLTSKQLAFVDGIYEKVMAGAGYESVNLHSDKKRKGVRYG